MNRSMLNLLRVLGYVSAALLEPIRKQDSRKPRRLRSSFILQ